MTVNSDLTTQPTDGSPLIVKISWDFYSTPEKDAPGALEHHGETTDDMGDDMFKYVWNRELARDEVIYVQVTHHDDTMDDDIPSRMMAIRAGQKGYKHSSTLISTPTVSVNFNPRNADIDDLIITTSDFLLYAGTGNHSGTSYTITDIAGNRIWSRSNDVDHLTNIEVGDVGLKTGIPYIVTAQHHSDNNGYSNLGKLLLGDSTDVSNAGNLIEGTNNLFILVRNYFEVDINTPGFKEVIWKVTDVSDTTSQIVHFGTSNTGYFNFKDARLKIGNVFSLQIEVVRHNLPSVFRTTELIVTEPLFTDTQFNKNIFSSIILDQEPAFKTDFSLDASSEILKNDVFYSIKDESLFISKFTYKDAELEYLENTSINIDGINHSYPVNTKIVNGHRMIFDLVINSFPTFILCEYDRDTETLTEEYRIARTNEIAIDNAYSSLVPIDYQWLAYTAQVGNDLFLHKLNYLTGEIIVETILNQGNPIPVALAYLDAERLLLVGNGGATMVYDFREGLEIGVDTSNENVFKLNTNIRLVTLDSGSVILFALDKSERVISMVFDRNEHLWGDPVVVSDKDYLPALIKNGDSVVLYDYKESNTIPVRLHL